MAEKDIEIRAFRWFETEDSKTLFEWRDERGYPAHIRPFSTMIAAMGNHWHEGCFESVYNMAKYTFDKGYDVQFYEEHDRCYNPYDALGVMRNLAYMKAIMQGYEFILYIDNDVKPAEDALVNLLHRFLPIISPIIAYEDGEDHDQAIAKMERNRGLAVVGSVPLSFLLIQTKVFLPYVGQAFWQDALGADESYHFQKLESVGHRPFIDTDVTVTTVSPPHYPLDSAQGRNVEDLNKVGLYVPNYLSNRK